MRNIDASRIGMLIWLAFLVSVQTAAQDRHHREVAVEGILGVIAAGANWHLAWQGTNNADGIVGTSDGGLIFAQEQPSLIGKLDQNDNYSVFLRNTNGAGSLAIGPQGQVMAVQRTCTDPGRQAADECLDPTTVSYLTPEKRVLANSYQGMSLGRLNDLVADRSGGAYFSSGSAYYVNAQGDVTRLDDDLRTNGIMLSPDERTLYVTNRDTIVAFDVRPDGSVGNRRDFAKLEAGGNGDGMAVDSMGRLYVTSAPGVQIFSPAGEYIGVIPTPRRPISVAFSGPAKRDLLYIVGMGALGPDGIEFKTPEGVRNSAKTIYRIPMLARGFSGRAK